MDPLPTSMSAMRRCVFWFAGYALAGAILTLIGWFARAPRLTDWAGSGITMFPNTAVAGVCAGVALSLDALGRPARARWVALLGGFVALIGGATLLEHLSGIDLGIDTLLVYPTWENRAAIAPGRMGPPAATSYALLGAALMLVASGRRRARGWAVTAGIVVCAISGLALLGYGFGADPLFAVAKFTGIAFQTATILLALALALLASVPEHEPVRMLRENSAAGLLARRSLPFIVGLPILLGWVRVRGQLAGWFDTAMGTALLTVVLVAIFCGLLWWWGGAVGKYERALRQSELAESTRRAELETLMETAPAAIWMAHDAQCSRITGNPTAYAMQRMSPGTNMSMTPPSLEEPPQFAVYRNGQKLSPAELPMQTAGRTARAVVAEELEFRFLDGSSIWIFGNAVPLTAAGGAVRGVVATFVDITARKRAEEKLRDAQEKLLLHAAELEAIVAERTAKLQETVSDLQSFSYSIAHDMRAPLRAMGTFAQILKEEMATAGVAPELKNYAERIVIAAARLDNLINDALNYTKAALHEFPLQEVDVGGLVRGLVDTYPNLHPEKADVRIQGSLPVVLGNESLLTQCFSNLLGNAVKFVAPGVRPQVRTWCEPRNGAARIWVEDNGIGIPPHAQPRLFAMFEKLDNRYEGTGIGLAIVRKVVERMGGKVGVESEPDRGSRFWVELRPAQQKEHA